MLGGLGYINAVDVQGSQNFLRELKLKHRRYALDCGAGIGRVSKNLLMPLFDKVDLVEQDATFAERAREYCTTDMGSTLSYPNKLGEIYNSGLQEFTPSPLTDEDLLNFFNRIKSSLVEGGLFVMKENVTKSNNTDKDETDSSVTRPLKVYENFLKKAGYRIVKMTKQQNLPRGLYPVYMIASRPLVQTE